MHHQSVRISLAVLTQNEDKSPLGHNKDLGAFVPWALVSEEQESEKSFVEALPSAFTLCGFGAYIRQGGILLCYLHLIVFF